MPATGENTNREYCALDALFEHAEQHIALLRHCRPTNASAEVARLAEALERGQLEQPRFVYPQGPELSPLRHLLGSVQAQLDGARALGGLYAARAAELDDEARLVEAIGTPSFRALANARYGADRPSEARAGHALAEAWTQLPAVAQPRTGNRRAGDARCPKSLLSQMLAEIGRLRLPYRVVVTRELDSAAATGNGIIWINEACAFSEAQARRIVRHEVLGHALPRVRARAQALGLFRVGCAGAGSDEEGRALLLEQRGDLMDDERRRELGLRHVGATAVQQGASFADCIRLLSEKGCPPREAVTLGCRLFRGGGLCREAVYLPALDRVSKALQEDPDLERWLASGRIDLRGAARLRNAGLVPEVDNSSRVSTERPG